MNKKNCFIVQGYIRKIWYETLKFNQNEMVKIYVLFELMENFEYSKSTTDDNRKIIINKIISNEKELFYKQLVIANSKKEDPVTCAFTIKSRVLNKKNEKKSFIINELNFIQVTPYNFFIPASEYEEGEILEKNTRGKDTYTTLNPSVKPPFEVTSNKSQNDITKPLPYEGGNQNENIKPELVNIENEIINDLPLDNNNVATDSNEEDIENLLNDLPF